MSHAHSRDMSTLVGTSKTLERAISGMQMTADRVARKIADEVKRHPDSAGLKKLLDAIHGLSSDEHAVLDMILSGRQRRGKRA